MELVKRCVYDIEGETTQFCYSEYFVRVISMFDWRLSVKWIMNRERRSLNCSSYGLKRTGVQVIPVCIVLEFI